jgi:hypothetical protein
VITICFGVILSRGINTVWWRTALHGTTLERLHHIWSSGDSVVGAAFAGQNFTVVSLAKIMILVTTGSIGPLLQKSSHVETLAVNTQDMQLNIPTTFHKIDLGTKSALPNVVVNKSAGFMDTVQEFFAGNAMITNYPCPNKTCQGLAPGPMLERFVGSCDDKTSKLNLTTPGVHNLFDLSLSRFQFPDNNKPGLQVKATFAESIDEDCIANMRTHVLEYRTGKGTQGVLIQNSTLVIFEEFQTELVSERLSNTPQEGFLAFADHPGDFLNTTAGSPIGPLTALWWVGDVFLVGNYTYNRTDSLYRWGSHAGALQYINNEGYVRCHGINRSVPTFNSPIPDVDRKLNSLIFRLAKHLAAPDDIQNFTVLVTEPVFISNYPYLWAAVAVYGTALIISLMPLWAWWELGRTASMSPIETAHAFEAPIFRQEGTNLTAEELVETAGSRRVQYGVLQSRDDTMSVLDSHDIKYGRLVLADTDNASVEKPRKGQSFDC